MKAWMLNDIGDIRLEDVAIPEPKENEVLIKVKAAGICGSDIPRIYKTGAHVMPLIPGHEFSGVVEGVGKNASSELIGKRVAVYPKIACGKCIQCVNNRPHMCTQYDYSGSRRDGAFAEYVTVPEDNILLLPVSVTFEEAAMLEPLAVAANAIRTGDTYNKDSPVAVCGLGTIGLMVVMLLKEAGYKNICVVGNKKLQKDLVYALGIDKENFLDINKENVQEWFRKKLNGGTSVYYECVGRNESISWGMDVLSPGGKMVLVGNPYSDMTFLKDTYWKILRNQLTITGIWNSRFSKKCIPNEKMDDWNYALSKISEGKIKPEILITHKLAIENLEKGFLIMRDKSEEYCKVMMTE
ncbi:MAG: galactitol-1-phosphate 5-dehydrogenase [Lachnospiraceae bacterium]|nr:galactitol-1-phosphate 5-dehydrogenase [Lachnospiraceae bacterium]